jgi:hypothetical protein
MCLYHSFICSLSDWTIFFHFISWKQEIRKKIINMKCVFGISLQLLTETFIILRMFERDMFENVYWYLFKIPANHARLYETWIFSTNLRKTLGYVILWNFFFWEPSCFSRMNRWTYRQLDMTKLIIAFRNFANVPKIVISREIIAVMILFIPC